uniref:Uncharacterized protein n=2 Tax=Ralstonia solanacearum TaxID=305 RepID=A0A0S4VCR2_RALSL|nr:conserved exported protein of unknown function [Ralstonia solanacearum]
MRIVHWPVHTAALAFFCLSLVACETKEMAAPSPASVVMDEKTEAASAIPMPDVPERSAPADRDTANHRDRTPGRGRPRLPEVGAAAPREGGSPAGGAGMREPPPPEAAQLRLPPGALTLRSGRSPRAPADSPATASETVSAAPPQRFTVEGAVRNLQPANVAFNLPPPMSVDETSTVELLLSFGLSQAEIAALVEAPGAREAATVRAGANLNMKAHLTGPAFEINPIEDETHMALLDATNRWSWTIKPKTSGSLGLHLTLEALLADGNVHVRTFDRTIEVKVISPAKRVASFIGTNWQWLWTTIVVPLVGWLWSRRRKTVPAT